VMASKTKIMAFYSLLLLSTFAAPAIAHEGHAEAPGQTDDTPAIGVITLSTAAITNLGIETEAAKLEEMAPSVMLNGVVDVPPQAYARVSSRFDGRVTEVKATIGDTVEKGQPLVVIEPLVLGSAPVTIYAPVAGRVTTSMPAIGQNITPSDVLFEIVDMSVALVRAQAYETPALASIKPGSSVHLTSRSYPGMVLPGKVERIDPALDPELRTLTVYVTVDNKDLKLLRHMQVVLSIETGERLPAVTIPRQAVLGTDGNLFVFVRTGNNFDRREVTLGNRFGERQEIISGVLPDDQAVTVGQYQLQFATPSKPAAAHAE